MATYLDRILDTHRASALADRRSLGDLLDEAGACPPARGFGAAIGARPDGELAVIAEVKRRSPSRGDLMVDLDPAEVATSYADGGASCLSVLTDSEWFGGSADDLRAARAASGLPVLRKDFTIDARDVCDARIMGADAVLLIAAALDDSELGDFSALATELGLDALVEVHDEAELERALAVGAGLVGVNQRDLVTFEVDTARATRVAAAIPPEVRSVAESGIMGPEDAALLAAAGYDAVLVGESVVVSDDRRASGDGTAPCAPGASGPQGRGVASRRVRQDLRDHQPGGRTPRHGARCRRRRLRLRPVQPPGGGTHRPGHRPPTATRGHDRRGSSATRVGTGSSRS